MPEGDATKESLIPAAQYVRMSSDQQCFSIDAQKSVIAAYAREHGYEIVETYADPGKSGLSLRGRMALQRLLSDSLAPERKFEAVLVLDVSRWGRFQDPDQAAHYEFICRQAGLKVAYCAETFGTQLDPFTTLVKQVKRVMAGEFSRELSEKSARAHIEQAALGFRQGGVAVYGFRRQLIGEDGKPGRILEYGEQRSFRAERVRIVPGPPEELKVVRVVFDLFVRRAWTIPKIVRHLRRKGVAGNLGRPWKAAMLRKVLTSELCIGVYTYNLTSQKLQSPRRHNPEGEWVRAPIFPPVVSPDLFARAQDRLFRSRPNRWTNDELLQRLRELLVEKGRLSQSIVRNAANMPDPGTYARRFGSMSKACREIGYVEPLCLGRSGRAWSVDVLKGGLKRLYNEHGYLSRALISADPTLPSYPSILRKVGGLTSAYAFIGVTGMTQADIFKAASARGQVKRRGKPGSRGRRKAWDANTLAARLRKLLKKHGYLSGPLIEKHRGLPSLKTVIKRYGSLMAAYRAAGWRADRSRIARLRCVRLAERRRRNQRKTKAALIK